MSSMINTNIASLNAQNNLNKSQSALATSLQRLSSGLRINSAKDDSAGLAISSRMTSQINGMTQAVRNANDGISLAQTAEGALSETTNLLQRMRDLSVQSANATNSAGDRKSIQSEVNQLKSELDRIAGSTNFNGNKLLNGSFTSQNFQIGADANQTIGISIGSATGQSLGINTAASNNIFNGITAATTSGAAVANTTGVTTAGLTHTAALSSATGIANQTITVTNAAGTTTTSAIAADANRSAKAVAAALTTIGTAGGVTSATATANTATLDFSASISINNGDKVSFSLNGDTGDAVPTEAISFVRNTTTFANIADQVVSVINAGTKATGITVAANGTDKVDITGAGGVNIGVENFAVQDNASMTLDFGTTSGTATALNFTIDGTAAARTLGLAGTFAAADATALAATISALGGGTAYTAAATGTSITITKKDGSSLALAGLAQTGGTPGDVKGTLTAIESGSGGPFSLVTGGTVAGTITAPPIATTVAFGATGATGTTLTEGATDSAVKTSTVAINLELGATISSSIATAAGSLFTAAASANAAVTSGQTDVLGGNNVTAQNIAIVGSANSSVAITKDATAKAIATAINAAAGTTDVTASATTTATLSNLSANGTVSFNLFGSNTTATQISATVTTGSLASLVTAINDKTGNTGVTAALTSSGTSITMTNSDGEDIKIGDFTHSAATPTGLQSVTVTGGSGAAVKLSSGLTTGNTDSTVVGGNVTFSSSSSSFAVQSDVAAAGGGLFTGAAANAQASKLSALSSIDVSTAAGAQSAISVIDGALSQVNSIRANLGAVQNRFTSTINSLQTTSENITGARSRIMDADFASETASLTRGQILQQAGTAMLAQANSLPNGVLALLR